MDEGLLYALITLAVVGLGLGGYLAYLARRARAARQALAALTQQSTGPRASDGDAAAPSGRD